MTSKPAFDPRTVAREIPGLFDAVFPRLTPGVVSSFNRDGHQSECEQVSAEDVASCVLQRAMLFELGFAVGETLLSAQTVVWDNCVARAVERQRRYFDAQIPDSIATHDREIAERVGRNLATMLKDIGIAKQGRIVTAPVVPGYQWIASGQGDFATGKTLVEVKCTAKNFSAADYRQLTMYWLLSYAAAIEGNGHEWTDGILLNPRSGWYVVLRFDEFLRIISPGRTKVDVLERFTSMLGTRGGA
mgnify:CR=1 FL=1